MIQTSKFWDAGVQYAAEIACEYLWHFMLELGSEDEEAKSVAADIYKRITGKDINIKEFLGL